MPTLLTSRPSYNTSPLHLQKTDGLSDINTALMSIICGIVSFPVHRQKNTPLIVISVSISVAEAVNFWGPCRLYMKVLPNTDDLWSCGT